jgi:uncharacterized membrane protein YfcA
LNGDFTPSLFAVAAVAAFFVGLSKGGLLSDAVGLYLYRRNYSSANLQTLIPSALLGVAIGWGVGATLSGPFISMFVGMVGVFFCLNIWLARWIRRAGSEKPRSVAAGVFWGAASGLTSFVSHSGAAAFQIYVLPQRLDKLTFAGTATILFAVINASKVLPYWDLSQFPTTTLAATAYLAPIAILGTLVGRRSIDVIPTELFFATVQVALFLVSLGLVVEYVSLVAGW